METLSDFLAQRLPRRPLACTGHPREHGLWHMSATKALVEAQHIDIEPPGTRLWLAFDIDRPAGALAWQEVGLPPPAWTTTSARGHGHCVWALRYPVKNCHDFYRRPVLMYEAVREGMRRALGGDAAYAGRVTRNPLHPAWTRWVQVGQLRLWGLDELAEWVTLPERVTTRSASRRVREGFGRNVELFDRLRFWAYGSVLAARERGSFDGWRKACDAQALALDAASPVPLGWDEVRHISTSVAGWTWARYMAQGGQAGPGRPRKYDYSGAVLLGVSPRQWRRLQDGL